MLPPSRHTVRYGPDATQHFIELLRGLVGCGIVVTMPSGDGAHGILKEFREDNASAPMGAIVVDPHESDEDRTFAVDLITDVYVP